MLQQDWGILDLIAGFRLLAVDARTNFNLALTLLRFQTQPASDAEGRAIHKAFEQVAATGVHLIAQVKGNQPALHYAIATLCDSTAAR